MAELSCLNRWERFVPDLGDNRTLLRPFYLEVASGLPRVQLEAFTDALAKVLESSPTATEREKVEAWAAAFAPYVRFGREPLVLAGKPIAGLADYFEALFSMSGSYNHLELGHVVRDFNSFEGTRRLFFERLSGGLAGTPGQSSGNTANQGAAPSPGSQTNAPVSSVETHH